ncbi:MAG: DNA primase [Candidatus Aenigmarchaeota archaeon]|nr:DNA primase [Candidatus Aenigmarchaeota archaeon]
MAKLAQTIAKYVINGNFMVDGIVEKHDVIGALFGQTEGLLGQDLDLRELQKCGKIGRIEVSINTQNGKTTGKVLLPSSLDIAETVLIAASLETVERIGPCNVSVKIESVEDLRESKRKQIIDRAKGLLSRTMSKLPETSTLSEELMHSVRMMEIKEVYGMPAGPEVKTSDAIILCEGRADVLNLLRHGVKNAIAVGGTAISKEIPTLCKKKEVTVFVDGDRGGSIIIKELKQIADIDYITKAPEGKEVEELTKKEIFKCLRDKVLTASYVEKNETSKPHVEKKSSTKTFFGFKKKPVPVNNTKRNEFTPNPIPKQIDENTKDFLKEQLNKIIGTKAAAIFHEDNKFAGRVPIKELKNVISKIENPTVIVLDGELDFEILKTAEQTTIKHIACTEKTSLTSSKIHIVSL